MRILLAALLIVAVTATYQSSQHSKFETAVAHSNRATDKHAAQLQDLLAQARTVFASAPTIQDLPAGLSAGCAAATELVQSFLNSTGCVQETDNFNIAAVTQQTLDAYCVAGGCADRLQAAITNFKNKCSSAADGIAFGSDFDFANLYQQGGYLQQLCVKENNKYCFLEYQALTGGGVLGNLQTEAGLKQVCTPCSKRLVVALSDAGGTAVGISGLLDLFCIQLDGKFCFLEMNNAFAGIGATLSASATGGAVDFAPVCVPCIFEIGRQAGAMALAGNAFAASFATIATMMTGFCAKNQAGTLCGNVYFAQAQSLAPVLDQNCGAELNPQAPCPAACAGAVATLKGSLGCCFGSIFKALGAMVGAQSGPPGQGGQSSANSTDNDPKAMINWIEKTCMVPLGNPCSGVVITAKIVIKNLAFSYYNAHKKEVEDKVRADLARFFKVSPDAIEILVVVSTSAFRERLAVQADTGLSFSYTVIPETAAQGDAISASIANGDPVPTPALATLPPSSRVNPTAAITTDPDATKTSVDIKKTGAASSTTASLSVLALLAAAAVALRV